MRCVCVEGGRGEGGGGMGALELYLTTKRYHLNGIGLLFRKRARTDRLDPRNRRKSTLKTEKRAFFVNFSSSAPQKDTLIAKNSDASSTRIFDLYLMGIPTLSCIWDSSRVTRSINSNLYLTLRCFVVILWLDAAKSMILRGGCLFVKFDNGLSYLCLLKFGFLICY